MSTKNPLIQANNLFNPALQEELSSALQNVLYDLAGMVNTTKQCHWNVVGPNFRQIHLHLDEIYTTLTTGVDTVAERLVTVGCPASGQAADVAKHSGVSPVGQGFLRDDEVIDLMTERIGLLCNRIRTQMEKVEDPDPVTADLLHTILEALEKHHWMLRTQKG